MSLWPGEKPIEVVLAGEAAVFKICPQTSHTKITRQSLLKMQALPHYQHCPLQTQNFSGRSGRMAGKTRPPAPVSGPLRHTALLASHDGPRRLSLQVWKCRAPMGGDTAWRLQGTPKPCSPHGTVGRLCLPAFWTLKPSCVCQCFHLNAPG